MKRRNFLQCLPIVAGLDAIVPKLQPQAAAQASVRPSVQDACALRNVVSGPITGSVARALRPPAGDPPLPQSRHFTGLRFTGRQRSYQPTIQADTWYPSWAQDGTLYSSYTDGAVNDPTGKPVRANSQWAQPDGLHENWFRDLGVTVVKNRITTEIDRTTTSGNATLTGDDPFHLTATPLPLFAHRSERYEGYYPCANLFYRGVWYHGGYYCHRWLNTHNVPITYELGGFGGFRISRDQGKTWQDSPFDDQRPLFPEVGRCSGRAPVRMGTPHFVDFGRELKHSPDGYAYLVGHGTYDPDGVSNWSSGDAISMARVKPSPETMNDPAAYEFFAGHDAAGKALWSKEFQRIAPLITWPGGAGCVNITYQPALKRYFGFMCGGWADGDSGNYNIWVVESENLTGPWFSVACLRGVCGGQPYFVCMPSKFNRDDSGKIVLFYSANWRKQRAGVPAPENPEGPGGNYSLCVAEFELLRT